METEDDEDDEDEAERKDASMLITGDLELHEPSGNDAKEAADEHDYEEKEKQAGREAGSRANV